MAPMIAMISEAQHRFVRRIHAVTVGGLRDWHRRSCARVGKVSSRPSAWPKADRRIVE
jgi:hypothetical protein